VLLVDDVVAFIFIGLCLEGDKKVVAILNWGTWSFWPFAIGSSGGDASTVEGLGGDTRSLEALEASAASGAVSSGVVAFVG